MTRMMKFAKSISNASAIGFEAALWATADNLRGNLGPNAPTASTATSKRFG